MCCKQTIIVSLHITIQKPFYNYLYITTTKNVLFLHCFSLCLVSFLLSFFFFNTFPLSPILSLSHSSASSSSSSSSCFLSFLPLNPPPPPPSLHLTPFPSRLLLSLLLLFSPFFPPLLLLHFVLFCSFLSVYNFVRKPSVASKDLYFWSFFPRTNCSSFN